VGSHLLLDWTNSYGIRLLLPFSSRWFYGDLNSLTDFVMLSLLFLAAVWPLFARLVGGEIGSRRPQSGRASAIAVLIAYLLFDTGRAVLQRRAIEHFEGHTYENEPVIQVVALPSSGNPFAWTVILRTRSAYRITAVNLLQPDIDTGERAFYFPGAPEAVEAAARTEPFRYFRYFARFPVWSVQPVTDSKQQGTRVELTDLRFGAPGEGSFHCVALLDNARRVLWSRFGYAVPKMEEDSGRPAR
jgi:inner membrane protein